MLSTKTDRSCKREEWLPKTRCRKLFSKRFLMFLGARDGFGIVRYIDLATGCVSRPLDHDHLDGAPRAFGAF